jgi:hypothetical protein
MADDFDMNNYTDPDKPPFFIGQRVIGRPRYEGSKIKKGQEYTISACHFSPCKEKYYWYVGVDGGPHIWMAPYLFIPKPDEFKAISLSKVLEQETNLISAN